MGGVGQEVGREKKREVGSRRRGQINRTIQLAEEEAEVLRSVLEEYISELRMEVANTDSMDFREDLKRKEEILKALVGRLR
jgi:hypothetical protein